MNIFQRESHHQGRNSEDCSDELLPRNSPEKKAWSLWISFHAFGLMPGYNESRSFTSILLVLGWMKNAGIGLALSLTSQGTLVQMAKGLFV